MVVLIDAPASPFIAVVTKPSRKGRWGADRNYAQSFACDPDLKAAIAREAAMRGITKSKLIYQALKAVEEFGVWDTLLNPENAE